MTDKMNNKIEEPVISYNQINLSFSNYSKQKKLEPLLKYEERRRRKRN